MLRNIEKLLKERGPMATRDIAINLDSTIDAVTGMLEVLKRKGRVTRMSSPCSQKCPGCASGSPEDLNCSEVWTTDKNSGMNES